MTILTLYHGQMWLNDDEREMVSLIHAECIS